MPRTDWFAAKLQVWAEPYKPRPRGRFPRFRELCRIRGAPNPANLGKGLVSGDSASFVGPCTLSARAETRSEPYKPRPRGRFPRFRELCRIRGALNPAKLGKGLVSGVSTSFVRPGTLSARAGILVGAMLAGSIRRPPACPLVHRPVRWSTGLCVGPPACPLATGPSASHQPVRWPVLYATTCVVATRRIQSLDSLGTRL